MHIHVLQAIKDKVGEAIAMKTSRTLMNSYYTRNFTKEIQGVIFTNKHTESSTLGFRLEEVTC